MPKFLIEARFSPDGVRGVAQEGGTARRDAIRELFEANGGTLESFYFAFGPADVYVIGDLPDNETATAIALSINSSTQVAVRTVVLIEPEQVDAAARKSIRYRPPGA
jgi:uncharacterized protein with GYD domain